ncbi:ATP-binding protein [Kitasatospora sp. NPDC058201]|uniref:sensor histidine kinase n=1 Tax=unclassified Kitasatospora TaxID=2633591 RepID=UPI003653F4E7
MAVFARAGRHRGRAAAALAADRTRTQEAAVADFVDAWLPHLLRCAETGLPARLDGAHPAVVRAADLVLGSTGRIRRLAAEETAAAVQPILDQLVRQGQDLFAAQQSIVAEVPLDHLYRADHANVLAAHLGVRLSVLSGGPWPARARPVGLHEVARAAQSRVEHYECVRVADAPDLTVVAAAVEPLVAAAVELLDNAVRHGGQQAGAVLECSTDPGSGAVWLVVTDNGPGLPGETLAAVRRVLAQGGCAPAGARWPGLGMRLVAAAVRHLNLRVSLTSVPRRTTAALLLPPALLVPPPAAAAPAPRPFQ